MSSPVPVTSRSFLSIWADSKGRTLNLSPERLSHLSPERLNRDRPNATPGPSNFPFFSELSTDSKGRTSDLSLGISISS